MKGSAIVCTDTLLELEPCFDVSPIRDGKGTLPSYSMLTYLSVYRKRKWHKVVLPLSRSPLIFRKHLCYIKSLVGSDRHIGCSATHLQFVNTFKLQRPCIRLIKDKPWERALTARQ